MPMSSSRCSADDRVGGVQRRQHEVAGQRRLHGDPRGLDVADLADQDDVGVLAQDRLEAAGEGDAGLLVDLDLVDRREQYSTGSSIVMTLRSGLLISPSEA